MCRMYDNLIGGEFNYVNSNNKPAYKADRRSKKLVNGAENLPDNKHF